VRFVSRLVFQKASTHAGRAALTYVRRGCVSVHVLVELPGSHGVHLDEGDAAGAPLLLRLVDGEEGLEEQIDNALGNRLGIDSQAGKKVVHAAHVPKLERGTQETSFLFYFHTWHQLVSGLRLNCLHPFQCLDC